MSRNKSFDVRTKFGAIYSASKTENYLSKNSTIGNRLLFSESGNTLKLLVPKIETGVFFFLAYLLYQLKPIPEISVKNTSKIFY